MKRIVLALPGLLLALVSCAPVSPVDLSSRGADPQATAEVGEQPSAEVPPGSIEPPPVVVGERIEPGSPFGSGSRVVLAKIGTTRVALVADEDDRAVHTFDLERRVDLARTPLPGVPADMTIAADGRLYVALRSGSAIAKLGAAHSAEQPLVLERTLETSPEPVGLALSGDGGTLYTVTGISHALEAFTVTTGERAFEKELPREPRAVLLHGRRAFVAHLAGSIMSTVDLDHQDAPVERIALAGELAPPQSYGCDFPRGERRPPTVYTMGWMPAVQGSSLVEVNGTLYAPQVNVWSNELSSGAISQGYGPMSVTEVGVVAAIDPERRSLLHESVSIMGVNNANCMLPWAAAGRPSAKTILVACTGSGEIKEYSPLGHLAVWHADWKVGAGPRGIAVDAERDEAVVFSQFDRTMSIIDLKRQVPWNGETPRAESFALSPMSETKDSDWLAGRRLFHTTNDPKISADGRACASCHPEGRDDGLAWSSPLGLRQTPSLAGRLEGTAPFDWEGDHDDLADHIDRTIHHRLSGTGLSKEDVAALAHYVTSLPPPPRASRPRSDAALRGEALFRSYESGCSTCHQGPALTDQKQHDVGSGGSFDTPSLAFVADTAPYFHDGRYKTLAEVLRAPGDQMGHTSQLDDAALADLEAYLTTL